MSRNKDYNIFFYSLSFALIIAIWWILAATRFRHTGIIPTPLATLRIIAEEVQKDSFIKAIVGTLGRSFLSFFISFASAAVLAVLAHYKKFVGILLNPFIILFRSMPTIALILILLLTVGSVMLPIVVSFLVVFPLCYQNMYTAISEVDKKLITMAKVFGVPPARQITGIYIPAMLPYIFSSVIAGFGLNIKVVISAEVMGLPSMSIGYLLLSAKQGFNFGLSFAWLVIAVIISLACEFALYGISRLCMPYKYPKKAAAK
jgi:NitT/TauT family transport system permease protein